jgi:hypothetical protein
MRIGNLDSLRSAAAQIRQPQSPYGDLARPDKLPKPNCRVMLVCGPPGAGKSTYVRQYKAPDDIEIDLDKIAREHGYGRIRPSEATGMLLLDRNERLAALAKEPADRIAWVIIGAPAPRLRLWWRDLLGVKDGDMTLLVPTRAELKTRIFADPDRVGAQQLHLTLVDQWFTRERENKASRVLPGCDASGWPTDPLHSWNDLMA